MLNDNYALSSDFIESYKRTWDNVKNGKLVSYQMANLKISAQANDTVFFIMAIACRDYWGENVCNEVSLQIERLSERLETAPELVSDEIQSMIVDKAVRDYHSIQYINAIKELVDAGRVPETPTMHILTKEPWLIVHDADELSAEQLNQKIFDQIIQIAKPEKVAQMLGIVDGVIIDDKKIYNILYNKISSLAYHRIVQSMFWQLINEDVFKNVIAEKDRMRSFFEEVLTEITFSIASGFLENGKIGQDKKKQVKIGQSSSSLSDQKIEEYCRQLVLEGARWLNDPYFSGHFNFELFRRKFQERMMESLSEKERTESCLLEVYHNFELSKSIASNFCRLIISSNIENDLHALFHDTRKAARGFVAQTNLEDPFEDGCTDNLFDRLGYMEFVNEAMLQILYRVVRLANEKPDQKLREAFAVSNENLIYDLLMSAAEERAKTYVTASVS